MNLASLGTGTMHVIFRDNTISNNNSSTGPGIRVVTNGTGTLNIHIDDNSVSQIGNRGIEMFCRDGSSVLNATVTNNTVQLTDPLAADAIRADSGATSTDTCNLNLDAQANDADTIAGLNGIRIRQRFGTTYRLESYSGSATDMGQVQSYLSGRNPLTAVFSADYNTTGGTGFQTTANVTMPTAP